MADSQEERLTNVEAAIMHLQKDVDDLSDSLLHNARVMEELKKLIEKLQTEVDSMEDEPRSVKDEKPPHY